MNQRDFNNIVYTLVARSLRRVARAPMVWKGLPEIPKNLTDVQKTKLAKTMNDLAAKMDDRVKEKDPIELKEG